MPAKTPGIGSDARIGDDATGPVLTGGNTEMEEKLPRTPKSSEDGTLEYGGSRMADRGATTARI